MIRMILTGMLVAVLTVACSKAPEQKEVIRPVFAVQVGADTDKSGRSFPGRAQANQEVDLSFRVAGPLIELPNDIVGRAYQQGDVIARIDPRDYEVQLQDAEGRLEQGRSAEKRAQGEYQRELNIYKQDPGATSKTSVDRKRDLRDQAAGDVKSLEAAVQAAKDNLDYTYLKAPFDGAITSRYVDNFQDVRAKQHVVRLLDASRIQIVVDIPETLISRLPQVEEFWVIFDAFPGRKIPAELFEVGTEASLTTRTYPVTLIMDPPEDIEILAGMASIAVVNYRLFDEQVDAVNEIALLNDLMTHDINNFNQGIMGYLELLLEDEHLQDNPRKYAERALVQVRNNAGLIDNMRTLAKVRTADEKDYSSQDLGLAVNDAVAVVERMYTDRQVTVVSLIPPKECFVRANTFLRELFVNVLSNAVKFDQSMRVRVNVSVDQESATDGEYWHISITDHGRGIPDDRKKTVFERFATGMTGVKGFGLGLSIVSTMVDRFGGRIWVEDRVPGDYTRGAIFRILLPKAEAVDE